MDEIRVLSTACNSMFAGGFFRCLKNNGERNIYTVGADIVDNPVLDENIDRYYRVPECWSDQYILELLDVCKKEKIDVFFPQISMEIEKVQKNVLLFESIGTKVAITNNENIKIANDKLQLYGFLKENKLTVPQYFPVESINQFEVALNKLGFPHKPVCVKISNGSGGRGIRTIRPNSNRIDSFIHQKPNSFDISHDEIFDILKSAPIFPKLMAMEYLPGPEYTVDLLADKGKTLYICGRRNIKSDFSIATDSIVEKNDESYSLCRKIVECLNLDGNIGFDFLFDDNGKPVLTDLNPRITATIVIYLKAGINFPYLRVKQLLGESLPTIKENYGARMVRKYKDIFV